MNLLTHYTKNTLALQALFAFSKKKLLSFLPDNLDVLLQQSGCVKRFHGISSPLDLLWGMFFYAVSGLSFSLLSAAMAFLGVASISDTHVDIVYNEIVYCNVHPYGLPVRAWVKDFETVGIKIVTPSKYSY